MLRCGGETLHWARALKDPVSKGLHLLAAGLRPYIAARVEAVFGDFRLSEDIAYWDAQALMVFMWDRWNELFRNELSFVERSLISELRDFRNRWAHQDQLTERDIYRILDDIERLLIAVHSDRVSAVVRLRRESLNRLWLSENGDTPRQRRLRMLWPYVLCGISALGLDAAVLAYTRSPWSWILSSLVLIALMRLAYLQAGRESVRAAGPRECSHCGRIIYSIDCPYCVPVIPNRSAPVSNPAAAGLATASVGKAVFRREPPDEKIMTVSRHVH